MESVKNALQDLTADLQELKEDRRVLLEKVESLQENNAVDDGKIPPEISVSLKIIIWLFSVVVYLIFDFHFQSMSSILSVASPKQHQFFCLHINCYSQSCYNINNLRTAAHSPQEKSERQCLTNHS